MEKLHALAERLAEASRQKDDIVRLRKEGKFEKAKKRLDRLRISTEEIINLAHTYADLHQGLIDIKVFDAFITPALNSRVEEQVKALEKSGQ